MRLRGMLATGALAAGVVLLLGSLFDLPTLSGLEKGLGNEGKSGDAKTPAMAPLSLGSPAAAAALRTRLPSLSSDAGITNPQPYDLTVRPQPGDILFDLITSTGVSEADAYEAVTAMEETFDARKIRAGQAIKVRFLPEGDGNQGPGKFLGFSFNPAYDEEVAIRRRPDGFYATTGARPLKQGLGRSDGRIESSLYMAGTQEGVPAAVLVELIRIFSWDVDFQRDIRKGDSFELMYERFFDENGELVHNGRILFASLTLGAERHAMYLFESDKGADYFDDKGQAARKALLRTPINGARLSSGFGRRRHPILGYSKMHRGIDFAAPTGTPILAGGDGVIEYSGLNGGYGKYIRIRHANGYSTAYAHMSRHAKGMRKGRRIRQGQVIGYVGSTGRSTGPHLHYEILVKGRHTNPLQVRMPSGRKLDDAEQQRFLVVKRSLDTRYASLAPDLRLAAGPAEGGL